MNVNSEAIQIRKMILQISSPDTDASDVAPTMSGSLDNDEASFQQAASELNFSLPAQYDHVAKIGKAARSNKIGSLVDSNVEPMRDTSKYVSIPPSNSPGFNLRRCRLLTGHNRSLRACLKRAKRREPSSEDLHLDRMDDMLSNATNPICVSQVSDGCSRAWSISKASENASDSRFRTDNFVVRARTDRADSEGDSSMAIEQHVRPTAPLSSQEVNLQGSARIAQACGTVIRPKVLKKQDPCSPGKCLKLTGSGQPGRSSRVVSDVSTHHSPLPKPAMTLLDSGANACFVGATFAREKLDWDFVHKGVRRKVRGAGNCRFRTLGSLRATVSFNNGSKNVATQLFVVDDRRMPKGSHLVVSKELCFDIGLLLTDRDFAAANPAFRPRRAYRLVNSGQGINRRVRKSFYCSIQSSNTLQTAGNHAKALNVWYPDVQSLT